MNPLKPSNHVNKFARALWRRYAHAKQIRPHSFKYADPWKPSDPDVIWLTSNHRFLVFLVGVGTALDMDRMLLAVEAARAVYPTPEARALYITRQIAAEDLEVLYDEGIFVAELRRDDTWAQWDDETTP